jgi:hypothetical protein
MEMAPGNPGRVVSLVWALTSGSQLPLCLHGIIAGSIGALFLEDDWEDEIVGPTADTFLFL